MKNLKKLVDDLKIVFRPKLIPYEKIYNSIREMEASIPGPPDQTPEEWEAAFIAKHGTYDEFLTKIKNRKLKED